MRKLVSSRVFQECLGVAVVEEVETTNFVWTVVAAVTRSDTAVVNHVVQTFATVNRCGNRANRFARSVLTVVTGDGLVNDDFVIRLSSVFVVKVVAVVAVDANPVHLATTPNFCSTHNGNVVFSLAACDA